MRSHARALLIVATTIVLASCAPSANPLAHSAIDGLRPAGFLLGLWRGLIIWVSFFVSLFNHSVGIYELHNTGWPYNLGFVIGAASLHGGGAAASRRRRPKPKREDTRGPSDSSKS